ncbi:MAG: hypothetical protein AB8E15_05165, partial [Bdellovibrionales bacterium]
EASYYNEIEEADFPPNRPFRTIEELHFIPEMDDILYRHLAPQLTTMGAIGISVNQASTDVLRSIDTQITDENAQEIKNRINDPDQGPFKNLEEFTNFLESELNLDLDAFNKDKIPLIFDEESVFEVVSTGGFGKSTKTIRATIFNFNAVQDRLYGVLKDSSSNNSGNTTEDDNNTEDDGEKNDEGNQESNSGNSSGNQEKKATPPDEPRIVEWREE